MKHEILIGHLPEGFVPAEDLLPFYIVRQEKMALPADGILRPHTVGVRCAGYFRAVSDGSADKNGARDALSYGLMTAQFRLSGSPDDFAELFTVRQGELIAEANAALEQSESPFRLETVVFGYADCCVHDGGFGQSSQRYSGFVIGQTSTRQVVVHKPKGIPGEWQCVCGAYSTDPERCEECKTARPELCIPEIL